MNECILPIIFNLFSVISKSSEWISLLFDTPSSSICWPNAFKIKFILLFRMLLNVNSWYLLHHLWNALLNHSAPGMILNGTKEYSSSCCNARNQNIFKFRLNNEHIHLILLSQMNLRLQSRPTASCLQLIPSMVSCIISLNSRPIDSSLKLLLVLLFPNTQEI